MSSTPRAFRCREQQAEARAKRRIGLGVTGLADALLMPGCATGRTRRRRRPKTGCTPIARAAYLASVDLAQEKGAFPLFDAEKFLACGQHAAMDDDVRDGDPRPWHPQRAADLDRADRHHQPLRRQRVVGHRAGLCLCLHAARSCRRTAARSEEEVVDYAVQLWRERFGDAPLPEYFVNAQTLPPLDHVRMQAAAQKWVDSSISKTINCPEDIGFEAFKDVYMAAWDQGCKGCTTYRPNAVTGSVLTGQRDGPKRPPERRPRRRGRLSVRTPRPAAGAGGRDLQAEMAGQRTRDLHHHQRHRAGRPPAALRGLHQLQEHGAFRLDGGADADDLGGVPARRRCQLRGRGAEGGVRPARRGVDGGALHPLDPRRDRRA